MEKCFDVVGDVNFDVEAKHKTVHKIEMVELKGRNFFSKLDLVKAHRYHRKMIHSDDIEQNSPNYTFGLLEFIRMPFGLKNAGKTFQRFIHAVVQNISDVFVHSDDVLVSSSDFELRLETLGRLLTTLNEYGLRVIMNKYKWL